MDDLIEKKSSNMSKLTIENAIKAEKALLGFAGVPMERIECKNILVGHHGN